MVLRRCRIKLVWRELKADALLGTNGKVGDLHANGRGNNEIKKSERTTMIEKKKEIYWTKG